MRPFHTIAIPHDDILEGKLSMDIYAANLWEVYKNRGSDEYKDAEIFFKKTYLTKGLKKLIEAVNHRIKGLGGDSVIQLHTPFGGGKTHSLIALFHKAKEWNIKSFVFVGDKLNPRNTLIWEELEFQLTKKILKLKGKTVPSGDNIREILEKNQPLILLIDELIEYLIPARGIKIENTTLDSQILAFIKRLVEVVSSLDKTVLLITSPSRTQYSESDQILIDLLNERLGRVEKAYTPVEDYEINQIVRKRLFSEIDEIVIKDLVFNITEYFKKELILPLEIEPSDYRKKFMISYPFIPDVIECLYHRWGSFPTFQRTRGVLRLLSLVIYRLKDKNIEYITLGDFDLSFQELRRELIKNIGNEFDSIISADITDNKSGSKIVDNSLGESYRGLHIGTRCATTIFLYSFSTARDNGATLKEIKRSAAFPSIPSSIISEAVDILKNEKLFYIEERGGRIYFKSHPNLNKIIMNKIENVEDNAILNEEKQFLASLLKKNKFKKIYIWPFESKDIDDDCDLKLVVLQKQDLKFIKTIIEYKGIIPRIYRNTLFFLYPLENKRLELFSAIKRKIALEQIQNDSILQLTQEEKKKISDSIKSQIETIKIKINETYRSLNIPFSTTKIETVDLGVPTYGDSVNLTNEIYDKLKSEGLIIEKMVPLIVKEKYLKDKKYLSTKKIYENSLKTLGESRLLNKSVLKNAIIDGVKKGLFGLGTIENDKIVKIYWKEKCQVRFTEDEVLVIPKICEEFIKNQLNNAKIEVKPKETDRLEIIEDQLSKTKKELESDQKEKIIINKKLQKITLPKFVLPKGKVSDLLGLLYYLQNKFNKLELKIEASDGSIEETEYEDNIKEALRQMGIDI